MKDENQEPGAWGQRRVGLEAYMRRMRAPLQSAGSQESE
jgi:hypothetical protein